MRKWFVVFLILAFSSCQEKSKQIISGNLRIVGNIQILGNDTVYNGEIAFYDMKSGKLLEKAYYENGLLQGKTITYINDSLAAERTYAAGELDGYATLFNAKGQKVETSFYLKGREFGSKCYYDSGKISRYNFFSFDREMLLDLDYKELGTKPILDKTKAFFSFFCDDVEVQNEKVWSNQKIVYLYLFNPPSYNFSYSLVIIDSLSNDLRKVETFDHKLPFASAILDSFAIASYKNAAYAIKLDMYDPKSKKNISMYKRI